MLCFSIVLWLPRLAKSAPKSGRVRRVGCRRCRQNSHHAAERARFGSQNRSSTAGSDHFLKFKLPKFAPRCGPRAIRKSTSIKNGRVGLLLEVELRKICTMMWRESDLEVKVVKAVGYGTTFRGSKCFSRGKRRDFDTASA